MNSGTKFAALIFLLTLIVLVTIAPTCSGGDDDDDAAAADDDSTDDDDTVDDDDTGDDDDDDDDNDDDNDDDTVNVAWQEPPSADRMNLTAAQTYCADIVYDDHDDWRLPTITELRSLVTECETSELGGSCGVIDSCPEYTCWDNSCYGCDYQAGPGEGGAYWPGEYTGGVDWYWSSTVVTDHAEKNWCLNFASGAIDGAEGNSSNRYVRCVYSL